MKVWKLLCTFVFAACYLSSVLAAGPSPEGSWTSFDEKTGEKRAIIKLSISGDTLSGRLATIYPLPGDKGICVNCPDQFKDKKIEGMTFMWGLKDQGKGVWSGGSVLDPKNGKIYRAKITVAGNKLYVRGYLGVSVLGRTQTWVR